MSLETCSPETPEKARRSAVASAGNAGGVAGKMVMRLPLPIVAVEVGPPDTGAADEAMQLWSLFSQEVEIRRCAIKCLCVLIYPTCSLRSLGRQLENPRPVCDLTAEATDRYTVHSLATQSTPRMI